MGPLPAPPDAYWANVPWWGYFSFVVVVAVVVVVIGPWAVQSARSRPSAAASREDLLTNREAALQARMVAEANELRDERDDSRDLLRGWVVVAHELWHDCANAAQNFNSLLGLAQRVCDGKASLDVLRDRIAELAPMAKPRTLPAIENVEPKRAGETKYG